MQSSRDPVPSYGILEVLDVDTEKEAVLDMPVNSRDMAARPVMIETVWKIDTRSNEFDGRGPLVLALFVGDEDVLAFTLEGELVIRDHEETS